MRLARGTAACALAWLLAACSVSASRGQVPFESAGVDPAPAQSWVRCACAGCAAAGVNGAPIGGCSARPCSDAAGLAADCRSFCESWGFHGCGATVSQCAASACRRCSSTADCAEGRCFTRGAVCGRACSSAHDCGCETCAIEEGGAGVCIPPRVSISCAGVTS